jgi:hypothetical protein
MTAFPSYGLLGIGARQAMGLDIVWSPHAVSRTYLFPPSKNRSKRIHKKLLKRHGGRQVVETPAMYQIRGTLYAHPSFKERIEREFQDATCANIQAQARSVLTPEHMNDLAARLRGMTSPLPPQPCVTPAPRWPKEFQV